MDNKRQFRADKRPAIIPTVTGDMRIVLGMGRIMAHTGIGAALSLEIDGNERL
jgi:hypothetical protein